MIGVTMTMKSVELKCEDEEESEERRKRR